ncbi:ThiF family adenylyltransferase [Gluconobacter cerinus]|uniref:ThiF family adenylyltransferase n=1 Tax=Gluconobacter cerinus TaxID=38307 RepID=UPI001B8C5A49|nr:ThiF family adenylyltransferase [Gluconobacter cerinus]MBS1023985.1 ThiF family adenylyltransferase [Gluconobacter cerinus]
MWYLKDSARFAQEQSDLAALQAEVDWLMIDSKRLDRGQLLYDVEIQANGRAYAAVLRYPSTFPYSPPSVQPRVPERWSGHQYGLGELCLEWGPDTWVSTLTGSDMIRSAHKLLVSEASDGDAFGQAAPSRHATTIGQDLRYEAFRFLVTKALAAKLQAVGAPFVGTMAYYLRTAEGAHIAIPVEINAGLPGAWRDPTVSSDIERSSSLLKGMVIVLPAGAAPPTTRGSDQFIVELRALGCDFPTDYKPGQLEFLTIMNGGVPRLFWVRDGDDKAWEFTAVLEGVGGRSDLARRSMGDKTVGVVGCGSAGSKIAVSLARAGARDFVLIDDDVLLPENLVRHELDWDGVASHKVDALARRLEAVAPGCKLVVRRHHLGGQEANGSVDGVLSLLRDSNLIIDATADERVFNLLGGVVADGGPPLVWLAIYAGGIGGLVARSRPELDPSPQIARARIDAWCADKDVIAPRSAARYDADTEDGPMIADDADVAVIAAHAARFAIDILTEPAVSAFPVSAYFIGLKCGWIFQQPFHSFPVDLGPTEPRVTPAFDSKVLADIAELLEESRDRPTAT